MQKKKTHIHRVLALWLGMFLLTVFLVARPTEWAWPYWLYGLIWGTATTAAHYILRPFLEETIDM